MKHQSILPDSPDRDSNNKSHDNEPLMVFENKEEDEEGEEDTTILNMSLLRNLLGPSTTNLIEDANKHMGDDSDAGMMPPKNVSFSGVESVEGSLKEDDDKTHEELIQKIGKVKAKLTQLGIDKSAERAMRKKKDKSLVKLAKELNKRAADQQKKEKTIAKYKGAVADLEAKLSATRSEMDERIATNEKKTTDYNAALDAAHKRYRTCVADHDLKVSDLTKAHNLDSETVRRGEKEASLEGERLRTQLATARELAVHKKADDELRVEEQKLALSEVQQQKRDTALEHEGRITEMIRKHEEQTDDLRRQLLEANLECDKIRTELASHQMQASPDEAGDIITRTLRSASFRKQKKTFTKKIMPCLQMATIVLVVLSAIAYQYGLLSMNAICAPVMPGTTLQDDADHMWEAPWWVPAGTMKESVFFNGLRRSTAIIGQVCHRAIGGDRPGNGQGNSLQNVRYHRRACQYY